MERAATAAVRPDVGGLRREFSGEILEPQDDGYGEARRVWNAAVDRRPALIARCVNRSDVAAVIRFARRERLELGVRGGGHSVLGLAVPEGGVMLDLSAMARVRVDPDRRRAFVQGGALLGALDRAAQRFGLATTAGNVSHTGVGGLTLGGGMGWLARRFGLACDNVARFEVVTAAGEVLQASESENADLFWGLRGGGGNFGVVTEFEFRLHPIGTTALVADLFYKPTEAPGAMRKWRDLLADAPPEATLTAWAGTARDWSFIPAALRHRPLISVGYVFVGDPEAGRELLSVLRDVAPVGERIRTLTYLDLQRIDDDPQRHRLRRYWKGHYVRSLNDEAIGAFLSRGVREGDADGDSRFLASGDLQSYGGAIASASAHESAFGHRDAVVEFVARASWTDSVEDETRISTARRYGAAIEPFASGVYLNDLSDEGQDGVRRAYGEDSLARLTALKDRYDPANLFHLNHNIRPSVRADRS